MGEFLWLPRRKPVVVYNRRGTRLTWTTWRLTRQTHYHCTPISPNLNQGVEAARLVSPLNGSYHKVSTVAPFLLDCSGLHVLHIPGHVISVSRSCRRGSSVCRFGAKETQPMPGYCRTDGTQHERDYPVPLFQWLSHPSTY